MTRSLSTSLDEHEVWFVTGSQTLYGEETLRQVAEQSQAVADGTRQASGEGRLEAGAEGCRQHPPARP